MGQKTQNMQIEIKDDEDCQVELNSQKKEIVQDDQDLILVGEKKGFVYTQIEKSEGDEIQFLGTAKVPLIYRYMKIKRLVTDPWSKQ